MARLPSFLRVFVVACAFGAPAQADMSARELWEQVQEAYQGDGQQLQVGSEVVDGDTLILSNITVLHDLASERMQMAIPEMRLKEMGDGSVQLTMSDEIPFVFTSNLKGDDARETHAVLRSTDLVSVISGTAPQIIGDMKAGELIFESTKMLRGGVETDESFIITLEGSHVTLRDDGKEINNISSDFAIKRLSYRLTEIGAADGEGGVAEAVIDALSGAITAVMPKSADDNDVLAALRGGAAIDLALAYGGLTMDYAVVGEGDGMMKASAGTLAVGASAQGVVYGFTSEQFDFSQTSVDLPFPIAFGVEAAAAQFASPILPSVEATRLLLIYKVDGLTMSDGIWDQIDPSHVVPHAPLTLVFDIDGRWRMLRDIFGLDSMPKGAPPVEIEQLNLNDITLSGLGASVTANGSFSFDNTDPILGYPKLLGAVSMAAKGLNALIDKVVAAGLLPADKGLMAKLGMGMIFVPDGADSGKSKMEFREDGKFYANGYLLPFP